jgi:hypothetical protein
MVNGQSHASEVGPARGSPDSATTSLEQFGYKQELKRSLSLFDLVVYGLVIISPASFGLFGSQIRDWLGLVSASSCLSHSELKPAGRRFRLD